MTHSFQPWPKIARLNRDIVVTEKIDGTNAAVGVERVPDHMVQVLTHGDIELGDLRRTNTTALVTTGGDQTEGLQVYWVWAQSRNRVITPGKSTDNSGFAGWVAENADILVDLLGEGLHFGEWWGKGIQRGYGLDYKQFSLFNTARYGETFATGSADLDGSFVGVVPTLYQGQFGEFHIQAALERLHLQGSVAAPGFKRPEGVIVYHTAASMMFKVTLQGDESPKGLMQHG